MGAPAKWSRSKREAKQRAEELREEIAHHDYRYYVLDSPEISDEDYDALFSELSEIEEAFPDLVTEDSPTQRVGAAPMEALGTVEHETPMLSLKAVSSREGLGRFWDTCARELDRSDVRFVVEPKFDGLSVELVYDEGRFRSASTRGDGRVGEDVTENIRTIKEVPLRLSARADEARIPRHLVVRGEVYMRRDEFDDFNRRQEKEGRRTFANPRNAAAGSVRQLDPRVSASRPLRVVFYEVAPSTTDRPKTQWRCLALLRSLGFAVDHHAVRVTSEEEAAERYDALAREREELPFEIDGVVYKLDDIPARERLGTRAANPRWALAWKFAARRGTSRVRRIVAQVGRTGALTPVAEIDPVRIGGVTVTHVSLHNQDEIDRKDVRIGDSVVLERAGDVIPHVLEVEKDRRPKDAKRYHLPERCPVCGVEVIRPKGEAITRCPNASCPAQIVGRILHFGSRPALDIDGLGEKLVQQLVDREIVEDLADLFDLQAEDLVRLERVGEKSADNLVRSIRQARDRVTLRRLVYGLGIPHVGRALAQELAGTFGSLDALAKATEEEIAEVEGVGEKVASAVAGWFDAEENRRLIERLKERGLAPRAERTGSRLEGKTIVITGSLESMTRDEAREAVERQGGRVSSSVSGETDLLVVGADPGRRKLEDAEAEGTKRIGARELLKLLGR